MTTLTVNGLTVTLHEDEHAPNPFIDWDQLGTLQVAPSCRYHVTNAPSIADRAGIQAVLNNPDLIALEVYAYTKGGITVNTTGFRCPWDSGTFGVISVSKKDAREAMGWSRISRTRVEAIKDTLRSEIKTLDDCLNGNVWRFEVTLPNGNLYDDCGGYTGDEGKAEALREATCVAENYHE